MKLYGSRGKGSGIAEAVLIASGISYEFVEVDGYTEPGPIRDELLALNPLAQVPTLLTTGGIVLTETAAIALYALDANPALSPPIGTSERERFLRLLVWFAASLWPAYTYGVDSPEKWAPSAIDELLASTTKQRLEMLTWLEHEAREPFHLGEQLTVIDIYVVAFMNWEPLQDWLAANTPKLVRIAQLTASHPKLAKVMSANNWSSFSI